MIPRILLPLLSTIIATLASAADDTVSAGLCKAFEDAWASQDADAIYAMMAPDCVFRSPFATHFGREEIRDTVLGWNLTHVRNARNIVEEQSTVTDCFVSSVGRMDFDSLNDEGALQESVGAKFIYIFTRKPGEDWKLQMLIYHEPANE